MAGSIKKFSVNRSVLFNLIRSKQNASIQVKENTVLQFILSDLKIKNKPENRKFIRFVSSKIEKSFMNNFLLKWALVVKKKKGYKFFEKKEKKWLISSFEFELDINEINKISDVKKEVNISVFEDRCILRVY